MEETNKTSTILVIAFALIVLALVIGVVFILTQSANIPINVQTPPPTEQIPVNPPPSNTQDEEISEKNETVSQIAEYTIELRDNFFSLTNLTANAGDIIRINLDGRGSGHDFVIDELNVRSNILFNGQKQTLEFQIPENSSGQSYEFYCSVNNHRLMGMVGTLTVL